MYCRPIFFFLLAPLISQFIDIRFHLGLVVSSSPSQQKIKAHSHGFTPACVGIPRAGHRSGRTIWLHESGASVYLLV